MIDFDKLRDPVFLEASRIEREKDAVAQKAARDSVRMLIDSCRENENELTHPEMSLVRSVENGLFVHFKMPSEKQLKWLGDIAARFTEDAPKPRSQQG